jgi:hypothetical protein
MDDTRTLRLVEVHATHFMAAWRSISQLTADGEQARRLSEKWVRARLVHQGPGGISRQEFERVRLIFEAVFLFGMPIEMALMASVRQLQTTSDWGWNNREQSSKPSRTQALGPEIGECLDQIRSGVRVDVTA